MNTKTSNLSKLWKSEDWLAVWLGFIIIAIGAVAVLTGAFNFEALKFSTWTVGETLSEAAAKKARTWSALQIAANSGTAIAKGVAASMDKPFPANLAALASTLAAVLAAIAQAKALAAEGHEHGGVIGGAFTGATRGGDNIVMTGRRGELVLNADQQKRLYDIADGSVPSNLTASLVEALRTMPAPVVEYTELQRFGNKVNILDNNAKLK